MTQPLLIFTHIPRAGGTSMWKIFRAVYGKRIRRIVGKGNFKTREMVAMLLKDKSNEYDVIGGHVNYGIGKNCVDRQYRYFTVLRDPTNVVLSRYYKRTDPIIQEKKARNKPGEFEENLRLLRNRTNIGPEAYLLDNGNPLLRFLGGTNRQVEGRVTRDHLAIAMKRLQNDYACFGFVERYPESMELISRTLSWDQTPAVERRNSGGNRPSGHDQRLISLGREVNALDYELYAFAGELFEEKLAALRI